MINNIYTEDLFSRSSFSDLAEALFKASIKLKIPIAIWTLPDKKCIEVILGEEVLFAEKPVIEKLAAGFIINGFENSGIDGSLFLKSIFYTNSNTGFPFEVLSKLDPEVRAEVLRELSNPIADGDRNTGYLNSEKNNSTLEKDSFRNNVIHALEEIRQGTFQKVILSRKKEIILEEGFSSFRVFQKLTDLYNNAFTSLTYTPSTGIWIGASPETLITVKDDLFKTCALAATQQFVEGVPLKEVSWKQKEIEEQAFVRTYIINCLKKIRLREFDEEGPKTVRAGNLLHLKTDITVHLKDVDFPTLASDMLDLLHPTSAVCGMPHLSSLEFILSHEHFKRELYAGYLGPVNINDGISLFVNLRCMKIEEGKGYLFAGGGITEDSVWEKEWQETEIKFRTLLNVLDL